MTKFKVGDKVIVTKNTVFKYLGYDEVTGIVKVEGVGSITIECDQTKELEVIELGDGKISKVK